jgi:hypothetical protein
MAFIWNIGIAPGNVKPRTGQVTRRTASLRNKSDDVEAEKGLSRVRAIRSRKKNKIPGWEIRYDMCSRYVILQTPFSLVDARQGREAVTSPLPALRAEAHNTTPPSIKLDR